jgi:chromosome transmission fidelity protein 8
MAADDTSWHKRVYLYVGKHQRLTGEVKKLPKPMAVLRKREAAGETDGGESELEIAEIVYYKLLFAHRPEPVGGGGG